MNNVTAFYIMWFVKPAWSITIIVYHCISFEKETKLWLLSSYKHAYSLIVHTYKWWVTRAYHIWNVPLNDAFHSVDQSSWCYTKYTDSWLTTQVFKNVYHEAESHHHYMYYRVEDNQLVAAGVKKKCHGTVCTCTYMHAHYSLHVCIGYSTRARQFSD